jgi:peptide/nickel transport system permease protein
MTADEQASWIDGPVASRGTRLLRFGELIRRPLIRVVARRLITAVPLLFIVSAVTFVLIALTPGDAARQILGVEAPPEAYQRLRHALGLDLPLYQQYWRWVTHAVHGDFGTSLITSERVTLVIGQRLPVTLSLIAGALLVTVVVGIAIGVFSAVRGGAAGRFVDAFALLGYALPSFWVGAALIALFAVELHWFPATGYVPLTHSPRAWLLSLVLPVIALALHGVAAVAKQTREAMLDALASEYIRMAWASGISPTSIFFRHALRNAAMRVVTILGLQFVGLLGGTVFVEAVFALPGLGGSAVTAASQHDLPVIQGLVVYFTVIVVIVNLAIDLAYTWLDPRVRAE